VNYLSGQYDKDSVDDIKEAAQEVGKILSKLHDEKLSDKYPAASVIIALLATAGQLTVESNYTINSLLQQFMSLYEYLMFQEFKNFYEND